MQAYDLEKNFFHLIVNTPEYLEKTKYNFFDNSDISLLFRFAQSFKLKYPDNALTKDQLWYLIKKKNVQEQLTENKLNIIWEAKSNVIDLDWYKKTLEAWISVKSIEYGISTASEFFRSQNINEENAQQVCNDTLRIINDNGLVSFYTEEYLDMFNPSHHSYDDNAIRKKMGVEFFDKVTGGGITPGEVWLGIGEANVGKSIWLCNIAKWYMDNGSNVVYVSAEMGKHKVLRRIGSNMFGIENKEYFIKMSDKEFAKNKIKEYKQRVGGLFEISNEKKIGELFIEEFPTSQLTIPQLQSYIVDKIEKKRKIKIDVVIIDYINLLSNYRNPNSENTYMKIKQLAEDMRGMARRHEWGIHTATQLKRDAYNSTDFNLEDAAESAALGHTVDFAYGIIQDTLMHSNRKYKIKVLKNRDEGYKYSSQTFDINYDIMRLEQTSEDIVMN